MTAAIYARVSTDDQHCEMQLHETRGYCERMSWRVGAEYVEHASGKAGAKRPEQEKLMRDARQKRFDVVVVWKLDRFGRSLHNLLSNLQTLDQAAVRFIALTQGIDTDQKSPTGRLLLQIMGAFAEFERSLIVERTLAGVAEAKRAGKHCGRPAKVFRRDEALELRCSGWSWRKIAAHLGQDQTTIRRAVGKAKKGVSKAS